MDEIRRIKFAVILRAVMEHWDEEDEEQKED